MTLATTGTVTSANGATTVTMFFAGFAYYYGLTFNVGASTANASINFTSLNPWWFLFETCLFALLGSSINARFNVGTPTTNTDDYLLQLMASKIRFASTSQGIVPLSNFAVIGGAIADTGTVPTTLLLASTSSNGGLVSFVGVDLVTFGSGKNLCTAAGASQMVYKFRQCKLGASVTLVSAASIGQGGVRVFLDNCDSADTNYRMQRHQYQGNVYSETVVVRNGGATDGTTRLAWRMVTSANSKLYSPLSSPVIAQWNDTTGASKTITVSLIHDGTAALNDDEVWIEVEYLGTAGFPLSLFADDAAADVLATAAAQATDTGSDWDDLVTARANTTAYTVGDFIKVASNLGRIFRCTTTGTSAGSEPAGYATAADGDSVTDNTAVFRAMRRQAVSVAVTPQEKGLFQACVKVAKVSYTLYVDPLVVVT